MIGIKTACAVLTDLKTLLLANTQEFSLAYSLLHDSLTCFMIYIMIIVQGAKFHVSRCLIYKVHSAKAELIHYIMLSSICQELFSINFDEVRGVSLTA